jgi:hypothetical protein
MEALASPTEIERDYLVNEHQGNTLLVPMIEIGKTPVKDWLSIVT